jgi:hypothetical protein
MKKTLPGESLPFRLSNILVMLLFVTMAVIQYDDPDPIRWALLYVAAAVACLVYRMTWPAWTAAAAVGLVALIWAIVLAPTALQDFTVRDLARTMKAETPSIEYSRELLGLLIVVVWMAVLTVVGLRRRRA